MSRAYEEIAVDALASSLSASLPSTLTAIDSSLEAPVAYSKAFLTADNRSPLIQIYDEDTGPVDAGQRHAMALVNCSVAITYNGRVNLETNELKMRRYIEGIRRVIMADPSLGGLVVQAEWTEAVRDFPIDYDSQTRHVRVLGVSVVVHDET